MKRTCIFILTILALSSSGFSQSDLKKEIEKIIKYDTEIEFKKTPGFLVHIIDGKHQYTEQFGTKEKKTKDTLTQNDLFQIGSVSKIFTSLLFQELAKKKLIALDDPIHRYLDPEIENESLKHLSIKNLLLHASTFPKRPNNFGKKEKEISNPYAYYTKDDLSTFYTNYANKPSKEKKALASYSHTNYALLEVIAEKATDTSFEELLIQYIFKPAALQNSGIALEDKKLAPGYRKTGKIANPWTFASFAASEGMYSNMTDLSQFLYSYFNDNSFPLKASVDSMLLLSVPTKYNSNFYSGMGWQIIKDKTPYDICAMAGTTDGHNAFVAMIPETKTAVLILANSAIGTEDLGMLVLRMINNNWKRKSVHEQE